jgi:hypothetical protein
VLASTRAALVALALAAGAVARLVSAPPASPSVEGVAALLGAAAGARVSPDDVLWEARGGLAHDAIVGRRVLFLGAAEGARRDLYRARVRVSASGVALEVVDVRALTRTPAADERELIGRGAHAAFASEAGGSIQGVTLLELDGAPERAPASWSDRAARALAAYEATGALAGLGWTEIVPSATLSAARFELTDRALVLALGEGGEPAALRLDDGALDAGPRDPFGLRAERVPRVDEPLGRALPRALGLAERPRSPEPDREPAFGAPAPELGAWPPAPLVLPAGGEAPWQALIDGADGAPPVAFATELGPDPSRPDERVRLVALDTRRLELRAQAGAARPSPETGPRGRGRFEPGLAERAIAVWGGGPDVDGLGATAEGRALVAPREGLPSIAIGARGRAVVGSYTPAFADLAGFGDVVALRQSTRWLVRRGAIGADAGGARVERSAMGLARSGALLYAWSSRATPRALAGALALAGAEAAFELASSPAPAGLALVGGCAEGAARLVDPAMSLSARAGCERAAFDFFYVVAARQGPSPPLPGGAAWSAATSLPPDPPWSPAVHEATLRELGAEVRVLAFAPRRFALRARAGAEEPRRRDAAALPRSLDEPDRARLLASIGVGVATRRGGAGLVIEGLTGRPVRRDGAALVLDASGAAASIARAAEVSIPPGGSAVELPLAADLGRPLPAARSITPRRPRGAACLLDDGTLLLATATFDNDEATTLALLDLGCARVLALERGGGDEAFFVRLGGDPVPADGEATTTLYVLRSPPPTRVEPAR